MSSVTMYGGCEFEIGYRFKTDSTTPKDLTGYSVLIQIRPTKSSSTVLAEYTESSSYITFNPALGSVDLKLTPSITSAFTFTSAVIDCLVYNSVDGDRSSTWTITYDTGVSRL